MKNFFYAIPLSAMLLFTGVAFGQAKKYPLFEHFTQASCGPCATQNPYFQAVYYANESNVHHVAYHTSWPGVDPMYNFNPDESDAMVDFYGVTGVPDMYINGSGVGGPAGVTQDVVNNLLTETSPIRIEVTESTVGSTRNVHVEVITVGTVPAGTYKIKAAVVEHLIDYITPPGTNGETEFPNVFRESITGTAGATYTPAAIGGSVAFDYSYTLEPEYVAEEIYALVWVQNSASKEVLNSGSAMDPDIEVINTSVNTFVQGTIGAASTFNGQVLNLSDAAGMNMHIEFSAQQPGDWTASYTYDGTTYTGATDVSIAASGDVPVSINVNVGATPAVGEYMLTVTFPDNPEIFAQSLSYYIIQGVTDLVVNNEVGFGDGSPYGTYDWESMYTGGLAAAGVTAYAATSHFTMKKGFGSGALNAVENIYYNVGWTFPCLIDDAEKIDQLMEFMDGGGNLFISGQDIGWEVNEYAAYYPEAVDFYENYLMANYITDAAAGATTFTAVTTDEWYGAVAASDISKPYGTTYYYPEQIEANNVDAFDIFTYNEGTKVGGVRAETADYKSVYLGIGIEMIEDEAVRNAVMAATYAYFTGDVNGVEFDQLLQGLLGGAQPNPAVNSTVIPMQNIAEDMTLYVSDLAGRLVYAAPVAAGTQAFTLPTESLGAGMYFYYLTNGAQSTQTEKLQVVK